MPGPPPAVHHHVALPSLTGGERCCLIMIGRARPPVRPDHVRSVCGLPVAVPALIAVEAPCGTLTAAAR
jgi:hypothetical protein